MLHAKSFSPIAPLALLAGLALAPSAIVSGQECPGDAGYVLDLAETVPLGTNFVIGMQAPAHSVAFLFVGGHAGPIPTKFGSLCVGAPFVNVYAIPMPATGMLALPHAVPCEPALDGLTGMFQFVAVGPGPGQIGLSNSQHLTAVDDGSCCVKAGDFVTFTQGGWGTKCAGGNPGCLRDQYFDVALPGGLLLGDQDGLDGDGHFALLLTSSQAVQNFLPDGGPASTFDLDQTNVNNGTAGVFAGQLAAAKLSVAFDDVGAFDFIKNQTSVKLGDLLYLNSAPTKLIGWSVRDVIALADRAISGELPAPIDVDNDGNGDVSLGDLSSALDAVNNNFVDGTQDNGVLGHP